MALAEANDLGVVSLRTAVDGFLSSPQLTNPNTWRAYAAVLDRIAAEIGPERPVAAVAGDELAEAVDKAWAKAAPATWNRNRAVVSSFLSWCVKNRYRPPARTRRLGRRVEHPGKTALSRDIRRTSAVAR